MALRKPRRRNKKKAPIEERLRSCCKTNTTKVRGDDHSGKHNTKRRTQLLFAVVPEVTDDDNNLTRQRDPERYRREWAVFESIPDIPQTKVWEHHSLRDGRFGHDDDNGAQHLRERESRAHVET